MNNQKLKLKKKSTTAPRNQKYLASYKPNEKCAGSVCPKLQNNDEKHQRIGRYTMCIVYKTHIVKTLILPNWPI